MAEPVKLKMYRITLKCNGIPVGGGAQAAKDIHQAFSTRTQHVDVHCWWNGNALFVTSWNDFDETGLDLRDEFSALISTYAGSWFAGDIETIEVLSMN